MNSPKASNRVTDTLKGLLSGVIIGQFTQAPKWTDILITLVEYVFPKEDLFCFIAENTTFKVVFKNTRSFTKVVNQVSHLHEANSGYVYEYIHILPVQSPAASLVNPVLQLQVPSPPHAAFSGQLLLSLPQSDAVSSALTKGSQRMLQ